MSVAIDSMGNKESSMEFERIHKALTETKNISSEVSRFQLQNVWQGCKSVI